MVKVKLGLALTALFVVGLATTAYAATTYSVSATGSPAAGSKKSPAPFTGGFSMSATNGANRQSTPTSWKWSMEGVVFNGAGMPTCTAAQIDAAQSDSVCPPGSLIGVANPADGRLGPQTDDSSFVECKGKYINMYNAGPNLQVWLFTGPGDQCAGVGYLPPFNVTLQTQGKTTTSTLVFPDNIAHPLPGIEGSLTQIDTKYINRSVKVKSKSAASSASKKGKKRYYMSSVGCSGTRDFTMTVTDEEGAKTNTTSAGTCRSAKKKK
jgi:hypothetical protein